MSMKLKETKERNARDRDGEHTCPVLVHLYIWTYSVYCQAIEIVKRTQVLLKIFRA